jgi:hypothetical protein
MTSVILYENLNMYISKEEEERLFKMKEEKRGKSKYHLRSVRLISN